MDVCFPVPTGNVLALAQELEKVIALESSDPALLRVVGRAAELIAERYSRSGQERELLSFWNALLSGSVRP